VSLWIWMDSHFVRCGLAWLVSHFISYKDEMRMYVFDYENGMTWNQIKNWQSLGNFDEVADAP
jgi:hypothetical protein